jgi:ferric-dicitrate binding protein FerR (iron transport regulator)
MGIACTIAGVWVTCKAVAITDVIDLFNVANPHSPRLVVEQGTDLNGKEIGGRFRLDHEAEFLLILRAMFNVQTRTRTAEGGRAVVFLSLPRG